MTPQSNIKTKLLHLFIFSIAMALLESAVVVYLRALYYPEGFTVALKLIDENILLTEILREAATLVMLCWVALLAGNSFIQRFSFFLFCFAVWDIFYYIWLKALINWPESLLTWDILFLIPVTWLGPVLAPLLCSATMIFLSFSLLIIEQQNQNFKIRTMEWVLLFTGCAHILFTFLVDYAKIIISNGWLTEIDRIMENPEFLKLASGFVPDNYNWTLFMVGQLFLILATMVFWLRDYTFHNSKLKPYENSNN